MGGRWWVLKLGENWESVRQQEGKEGYCELRAGGYRWGRGRGAGCRATTPRTERKTDTSAPNSPSTPYPKSLYSADSPPTPTPAPRRCEPPTATHTRNSHFASPPPLSSIPSCKLSHFPPPARQPRAVASVYVANYTYSRRIESDPRAISKIIPHTGAGTGTGEGTLGLGPTTYTVTPNGLEVEVQAQVRVGSMLESTFYTLYVVVLFFVRISHLSFSFTVFTFEVLEYFFFSSLFCSSPDTRRKIQPHF